jgi:hypothetical protein
MRTVGIPAEHRCYVQLPVFDYPLLGMVHTGADKSYLGSNGVRLCQSLNIPIDRFAKLQHVQLAGKFTAEVIGSVELPILLQGKTNLITCSILPTLYVDMIIGLGYIS